MFQRSGFYLLVSTVIFRKSKKYRLTDSNYSGFYLFFVQSRV